MLRLSIKMIVLMGLMALPSLSWAGPVVTTTVAGSGWWFGVSSGNYGFHRPYSSYGYSPYLWSPWRPRVSYDWWHYKPVQGANIRTMEEIAALGEIKKQAYENAKERGELQLPSDLPPQSNPELTAPTIETQIPSEI